MMYKLKLAVCVLLLAFNSAFGIDFHSNGYNGAVKMIVIKDCGKVIALVESNTFITGSASNHLKQKITKKLLQYAKDRIKSNKTKVINWVIRVKSHPGCSGHGFK